MSDVRYLTFMGKGPRRICHWEHWSCPDAETYLTGIDYYEHPRLCRLKMNELYPELQLPIPENDTAKKRPEEQLDKSHGRWGDGYRDHWQQEEASRRFKSYEEILRFSPLENPDFTNWHVVENHNYSSEEIIYKIYRKNYPLEWADKAPEGSSASVFFYNTMFMWPMLVFGYENFMLLCLEPEFERIMEEFAEINRRVFRAFAKLPVNFVICHDDIVLSNGPVCSPEWMRKFIFPRYEEFWDIVRRTGKEVIFMVDGCVDAFVDDIMSCGARGIISEPYTNYKVIAKKYKDCFIAGEGDNRILYRNNKYEIRKMVESMVETGKMCGGYMMCIGNHIPFDVPPEAIKTYLELSRELAYR
ncbi:MAG TPA: uroporphyrinogen decarboxylase family protein [Victivallales bacterium]|nr:uroporphyrinogen decarboxylase family protein [Victivallales bacterium]HPO90398.1 uroporphyrinogen decarboxylase family protein [Victivallales bacterium]HRR28064.1 uroporphyrinogen decarboxylase family protein [Victivallales bacterium]HRU01292.1 uroporphyrinogen decarboxylase family protein [Victivallales bacterium]